MREITMFEAEDGKRFESEEECILYERRARLTDEVINRVKAWDWGFNPIPISAERFNWTEDGMYFFAPDRESREAINYAFNDLRYVPPFIDRTEKSIRVKWDDDAHEFIDFDDFCDEMEEMRGKMS